jgi:hypothetical protein
MHTPPAPHQVERLAQSLVIFGRAHGQLAYAVDLYDESRTREAPHAYFDGRFGHPFTQIAIDKIILELANCLDEYVEAYEPLVEGDQPVEARAFFRVLAAEADSLRGLRSTIASAPHGAPPAVREQHIRTLLHTLPYVGSYWRGRAREAHVVLDAIWRHHARAPWFGAVRAAADALSVGAQIRDDARPSVN